MDEPDFIVVAGCGAFLGIELCLGLLSFQLSRRLAFVLLGLWVFHIIAAVLFFFPPWHPPPSADLGGANLAPNVVLAYTFLVSVPVWIGWLYRAVILSIQKCNGKDAKTR